jgi:hypothetical protein
MHQTFSLAASPRLSRVEELSTIVHGESLEIVATGEKEDLPLEYDHFLRLRRVRSQSRMASSATS